MLYRYLAVLIAFVFFAGNLKAARRKVPQPELAKLQKSLSQTEYLQADFDVEFFSSLRGKPVPYHGHAFFSRSGKFRWVQETPEKKTVVFDGKSVFQYMPDLKSAHELKSNDGIVKVFRKIASLVLDLEDLKRDYSIVDAFREDSGSAITMELKPLTESDILHVFLTVAPEKNYISEVTLNYKNGNRYTYKFSNPNNGKIGSEVFKFSAPKDVKVETL